MSLFQELKRRNVFRVGIAYVVAAWVLLQITEVLMEILTLPDWTGKLVLLLLAVGFLPTLIGAWAFEVTPEGIKREHEVDRTQSITHHTGRKLDFFIIGVLAIALIYFIADKYGIGGDEAEAPGGEIEKSIAVLPFVNMSADQENEYFSDGLSEELLNLLAKVEGLKVAARTSSFNFKGSDASISEIGEALGVATVLEGSVRRSGDQARITAQLIQVDDGFHLWSETYDRSLDDVFAVQDEIAQAIVDALHLPLLGADAAPVAAKPTTDFAAYDQYLLGRHTSRIRSEASFEQALKHFQEAARIDPGFAPAYAGIADTYNSLANYGDMSQGDANRLGGEAIDRALELDPELAEGLVSKAALLSSQGALGQALSIYEKALEINPNDALTWTRLSAFYDAQQLPVSGLEAVDRAIELDPLSEFAKQTRFFHLITLNRRAEAQQLINDMLAADESDPLPYEIQGDLHREFGEPQLGIPSLARAHELRPGDTYMGSRNVEACAQLDDEACAREWLQITEERGSDTQWTVFGEHVLLLAYGTAEDRLAFTERRLVEWPESAASLRNYGAALMEVGDLEAARQALESFLDVSQWSPGEPLFFLTAVGVVQLAEVYRRLGLTEQMEELLAAVDGTLEEIFEQTSYELTAHYLAARASAVRGDRIETLDALRGAVDNGFRDWWFLDTDPVFEQWRNDPLFQTFVREMKRDAARMRAELQQAERKPQVRGVPG